MSKSSVLATLVVLLCCACNRSADPSRSAVDSAGSAIEASTCLASSPKTVPAFAALKSAQRSVAATTAKPAHWVEVSREWVRIARQTHDGGFYLNVDACAKQALHIDPTFTPALEMRSLVLMNDHRFSAAKQLARAILARDPESVIAAGTLSDSLLELGHYRAAGKAVQLQLNLAPSMAALTRAAWLRWLHADVEGAKILTRDALMGRDARDPEPAAWVFTEAAAIYWHEGDFAGAARLFAEALRWQSDYPAALLGSARVALALGKTSLALEQLVRATKGAPSVEAFWLLGDAQALGGDAEAAEISYQQAEQIGRRGDRLNLAAFLAERNRRPDEALRMIEGERSARGGIYVDDIHAWVLYRLGRLPAALAASDRARRLGTRDARLLFHAGAIRIAMGQRDEGRELIAQALKTNSAFDPIGQGEARRMLAANSPALARN